MESIVQPFIVTHSGGLISTTGQRISVATKDGALKCFNFGTARAFTKFESTQMRIQSIGPLPIIETVNFAASTFTFFCVCCGNNLAASNVMEARGLEDISCTVILMFTIVRGRQLHVSGVTTMRKAVRVLGWFSIKA